MYSRLRKQQQVLSSQSNNNNTGNSLLLGKLTAAIRNRPFFCGNLEGKGLCCFNHIIPAGLPIKPSTGKRLPLFEYETDLVKLLSNKRRVALLKAAGLGLTECITIRWLVWKCLVNDQFQNAQCPIICPPRIQMASSIIDRMKRLFQPYIYFEEDKYTLELNKCKIMALPGHSNLAAARSLDNCKCCILEEIDFVEDSLQRETLDVAERYIGKNNAYIILISTANKPGSLMYKLFREQPDRCIYERRIMDWKYGENLIYTSQEIADAKRSWSWSREYECRFMGEIGNTFRAADIERAQSFQYDPDMINESSSRTIGIDPAWGSSSFAVVVSDERDGKVCVLLANEFADSSSAEMLPYVSELMKRYAPIDSVYIDGSAVDFIRLLKAQIGEEVNYQETRKRYESMKVPNAYELNNQIIDINFHTKHVEMLQHLKMILEKGFLMIDKSFEPLINALYNCSDQQGKVIKNFAGNDLLDALRLNLLSYEL